MSSGTATRAAIAALIYTMTNAVLFGAALITVMTVPSLNADAAVWIPVIVVASLIVAAPVAWIIAPRLQARYWRNRPDDVLSSTSVPILPL